MDQILKMQCHSICNTFEFCDIPKHLLSKTYSYPLLVIPPSIISTKMLFLKIDLGRMDCNSWFLDEKYMYDIVEGIPDEPYVLPFVDIGNKRRFREKTFTFDEQNRPLTLHEVVTLAFHRPELFRNKITGMQAYGSRFSKKPEHTLETDDTLEIYRKGDPKDGFAKLAREQFRYTEETKIIPHT